MFFLKHGVHMFYCSDMVTGG